jgi:hypothetical protein
MKSIINVVDRKRWGLQEHAHAVDLFSHQAGYSSKTYSVFDADGLNFFKLLQEENSTIIIWSLGLCALLIPLLRMKNKVIFICHEPGGLKQRFKKKDGFFYSLYVSSYELLMHLSNQIATPNKINAKKYNLKYLPLLYKPVSSFGKLPTKNLSKFCIYYLGRLDDRRGSKIFLELKRKFSDIYDFRFFPNEDISPSELNKVSFTRNRGCIFNFYQINHNQSGVTGDALRLGLPVIVSNLDFIFEDIKHFKLGKVIDFNETNLAKFIDAINELNSRTEFDEIFYYYNNNFGKKAFDSFWDEAI